MIELTNRNFQITIIIFSVALFSGSDVNAHATDSCGDLAQYACSANRDFNDGSTHQASLTNQQVLAGYEKLLKPADVSARAHLDVQDSNVAYQIYRLTGLQKNVATARCFDVSKNLLPNRPACIAQIEAALSSFYRSRLVGSAVVPPIVDVAAVKELSENGRVAASVTMLARQLEDRGRDPRIDAEVKETFTLVREELKKIIGRIPVNDETRAKMLRRLNGMTFQSQTCAARLVLSENAFYDPGANRMNYCPSMQRATDSRFIMTAIIAHEMAHSFDRCLIQLPDPVPSVSAAKFQDDLVQRLDNGHPLAGLVQCLRGDDSVGDKICMVETLKCKFGDSAMQSTCRQTNEASSQQIITTCPLRPGHEEQLEAFDQTNESMPDWFSAEVTPKVIDRLQPNLTPVQWRAGIANMFSSSCQSPEAEAAEDLAFQLRQSMACDEHPKLANRINGIVATNPLLREKMGCVNPPAQHYCDYARSSEQTPGASDNLNKKSRIKKTGAIR